MGDTIIKSKHNEEKNYFDKILDIYSEKPVSSIVAVEKVPLRHVTRYGIIKAEKLYNKVYRILDLVEKPSIKESPSNLAIIGRYLFEPDIFDAIRETQIGIGGEYQLTDSISKLLEKGKEVFAMELDENSVRYDIGNFYSYATAFFDICLDDAEIGEKFLEYIKSKII